MNELTGLDVQALLKLSEEIDLEKQQNRAQQFAAVSITLQKFISVMLDELEYAGFTSLELLEKLEMFLRAATPSYPAESFVELVSILEKIDPKLLKTKFYYGLNILRDVCTGQGKDFIEIIKSADNDENYHYGEVVFFITFLIESTIRFLRNLRTIKSTRTLSNKQIKESVDKKFDDHVLKTVMSLSYAAKQ